MAEHDVLAERFEAHRTRLRAVAYRTLGSTSEADDGRDVIERDREHVVQDEGEPLGGRQRVQDHQQRGTDGVGQQRLLFGVDAVRAADGRLGQVHPGRQFTA